MMCTASVHHLSSSMCIIVDDRLRAIIAQQQPWCPSASRGSILIVPPPVHCHNNLAIKSHGN